MTIEKTGGGVRTDSRQLNPHCACGCNTSLNEDCTESAAEGVQVLKLRRPEALRRVVGVHEVEGSSAPAAAKRHNSNGIPVARGRGSKELFQEGE